MKFRVLLVIFLFFSGISSLWADDSSEKQWLKIEAQGNVYWIPTEAVQKYPDLVMLLMENSFMDTFAERRNFLQQLGNLSPSQVDEIHKILYDTKKQLQAVEKEYGVISAPTYTTFTKNEQLELAEIYDNLFVQTYKKGLFKPALLFAKKVLKIRTEILGEKAHETLISMNYLVFTYLQIGQLSDNVLLLAEKSYRLHKEVFGEKDLNTLKSLNNVATIYKDSGKLSEALPLFEKSYHLLKEIFGTKNLITLASMNNLAYIYKDLGRLSEALLLFEKSYYLHKKFLGEKHFNTLASMNNLAFLYQDLGRLSEALPLFEKSHRYRTEVFGKKHPFTLKSLNNLALIYQNLGRLSEALPLSETAYRYRAEILGEKNPSTLRSLNNWAVVYQKMGRLSEALPLLKKSYLYRIEVFGEKHPSTLISMNNLAMTYRDMGQLSEALPLSQKAYSLHQKAFGENHYETLLNLNNLALIYQGLGKINQAIEFFEKLVKGVENLRSGDFSAKNRQALFKKWVPSYFILSELYIKQSSPVDAFRLTELSKSRTLLESLAAKRAAQESGITKTEQDKLQDYQARLAFFNNKIAKALKENRLDDRLRLETDKNKVVTELNQFHNELMAKYPKYAQLSKVQIISAKEGAELLPKDAVLISYLVDKDNVLVFTLQNNGNLSTHDLGEIRELQTDIENYRRYLSFVESKNRGTSIRFVKTLLEKRKALNKKLAKHLLEPLKDIIKDKPHWIISPSGVLATLPFETLRLEGSDKPVIVEHQISYVQSLSVLAMLKKRDEAYKSLDNRGTLFAMGAPLYEHTTAAQTNPSETDYNIARQLVMRGGDSARALRQLNLKWQTLPGSLKELEQLGELFKETKPSIYIQADATEAKLQSLNQQGILAKYRYLVFSAHGYLSPEVPALSSIVLGQVNNPKGIDGYVTAGEWPAYDLKSDLMVLSACQTGLGEVISGEGVMGLPYAFFVAGNKNTILTLWSISDEVTVKFITSFFKKLKKGNMGQIEALTATKREFIKMGGKYANPAYWSAFILYGSSSLP